MRTKFAEKTEDEERTELFHQHRSLLFSIAYRMLGTISDAEDILQDTFLRWQKAPLPEVQSPKSYLSSVVTNLCINHLQSARVQREQYIGPWLPEPLLTGQSVDPASNMMLAESLSMAFLVLLERLSPVERATFLLREIFDYEYAEIASIVGKSEVNCRQMVSRARRHIADHRPRFNVSPGKQEQLTRRFLNATSSGDLQGLVSLLADDVRLCADGGGQTIAILRPLEGADHVARFLVGSIKKLAPADRQTTMTRINGNPGLITWVEGRPSTVVTLEMSDDKIQRIYIVRNPEKLRALEVGMRERQEIP